MPSTNSGFSPNAYARAGGIAYLIIIICGFFGEMFVRNKLIVYGDPAATAENILSHQFLWRLGIAGDLLMHICDAVVAIVFYVLLKPVNRNLALIALFLGLVQTAVLVANKITLVMPLLFLGNNAYLHSVDPHVLQTLAYLSIITHGYGFGIGLIFFGCECLLNGYLIIKSIYLPRILGILFQITGVCYLVNSFALLLFPALSSAMFPFILLPPLLNELSMALWLVFKGVRIDIWREHIN